MSNALAFTFESSSLTVLGDVLSPLFVAKQVCSFLGFKDPINAVKAHVDPEDLCKVEMLDRLNRKQLVNCVNESGLYALIFGSKLPKAKQFKRWVTNEVLPTIRKQGHYQCPALDRLETLTPLQQEAIREEVSKRALRSAADYQTIYKALRLRFQVTRFDLIPRTKFETALKFIQEVELKAPVARDAFLFSYDPKTLSDDELESLARLIYLLDLAKPTHKQVYAGLRAVYSDLSPRFYSLMTETAISESNLKKVLDRNRIDYRLPSPN